MMRLQASLGRLDPGRFLLLSPTSASVSADATLRSISLISCRACSHNHKPVRSLNISTARTLHSSPTNLANPSGSAPANATDIYPTIFSSNASWRKTVDPALFQKLKTGQQPQILWIGCSDSRCPETTLLGLKPGDVFVHRNIANIVTPTDLSSQSVIEYAVTALKVKHVVVCGHTACGGVLAALGNKRIGLIDAWLMPLRALREKNLKALEGLPDDEQRWAKLVEFNVRHGIEVVRQNPNVIAAMREGLKVHGLIYNVGSGELEEIDCSEADEVVKARDAAFSVS